MKLNAGYKANGAELIKESYAIEGDMILINLDADHYKDVMLELCLKLPEPVFFVFEIPCNELKEKELRKSNSDSFHKEVCYIDGLYNDTIKTFFESFGDVLINDGLSSFGFSSHNYEIEIMKDGYNCLRVYAKNKNNFINILNENNIPIVENIVLVSDILSSNNPGYCERFTDEDGKTIFDLADFLTKNCGMYIDHIEES